MLLLVFISIAVGIVLVVSWVFYDKFILMAQLPPKEEEGEADSETLSESANLARLSSLAEDIPDPAGAAAVQEAVADYAASITEVQWPLLRVADNSAATSAVFDANITLFETIQQVQEADSSSSRVWNWIDSTMSDLGQDSEDRLGQLPASSASARVWTVIILGLAMLIMTTAFFPTRVKAYRISISVLAALTALMVFVMVQASNPYAQHVTPEVFMDAQHSGSP